MDLVFVSERLRQARQDLGLSLKQVSESTAIASERLGEIEAGRITPTGDDVLVLAAFYRCDYRAFIDPDRSLPTQRINMLFRRYGSELTPVDMLAIQEFLYLCEIESDLEKALGRRKKSFSFSPEGNFFKGQGKAAAQKLRAQNGYLKEIPVDIYRDFREEGVHVFRRRLSNSNISGIYVNHPAAGDCVLINFNEDVYRQRFSVAHEFAHSVFDRNTIPHVTFYTPNGKYSDADWIEIRANSFASEYLLPENVLRTLPKISAENVVDVASKLMVSCAALVKGLKDLRLISESEAGALKKYRVQKDLKSDPEAPSNLTDSQRKRRLQLLERGLTDYYVSLCFDAKDRNLISVGRLSEALMVTGSELSEIASIYGRSLPYGA